GLDPLNLGDDDRIPYLAHAARAFFMNGGSRLYVSRVFYTTQLDTEAHWGLATRSVPVNSPTATVATWRARWPGGVGNVLVRVSGMRGKNVAYDANGTRQARGARPGALVEVVAAADDLPGDTDNLNAANLRIVRIDPNTGLQTFADRTNATPALNND